MLIAALQIVKARKVAKTQTSKIEVSALLFRLNISANHIDTAMETFREAFSEIGITVDDHPAAIPTRAEEVYAIVEDVLSTTRQASLSPQDEMVIAMAKLCLTAGATAYSYSTKHSKAYFDHAAQLIVSNRAARRHTAAAYTYTMQSLLSADALDVNLARAWLRLANVTKGSGQTPGYSSIEAFVVTLEFLNCASITDMNYGAAYEACLASNNMDTLTYATGLDLVGSFLAGRDLRYTLDTGQKVLKWLQCDLSPVSKVMIASSIQLAANCSDTERDIKSLSGKSLITLGHDMSYQFRTAYAVLEGKYLTSDDTRHLDSLPPLFAIVYWTNALACGLFFHAPEAELRQLVAQVHQHLDGGSGTLLMFYSRFLLSWFSIMFDTDVDADMVKSTKKRMLAFGHSKSRLAILSQLLNSACSQTTILSTWLNA